MEILKYYPLVSEYRLINYIIDPDLLQKLHEQIPTFLIDLLENSVFLRQNVTKAENQKQNDRYDAAYHLLGNETSYSYCREVVKHQLVSTAFYVYKNRDKMESWLPTISDDDHESIGRYFRVLFSVSSLISNVIKPEHFIGFLAPLLSDYKADFHLLWQKTGEETQPLNHYSDNNIIDFTAVPVVYSKKIEEDIRDKAMNLAGITAEEWSDHKEDIRLYTLAHYTFHQFTGTGKARNMEEYVTFMIKAELFWERYSGFLVPFR